jgi:hypothetical protein
MTRWEAIHIVVQYVLLGCLLAINGFPYFTDTRTHYETIFLAFSAIHAELCLVLAWGLIADEERRSRRRFWCLLVVTAAVLAVTRLLSGKWAVLQPWSSILLGAAGTVPAILPIAGWFLWYRYRTGRSLVIASEAPALAYRYRLRNLFALTAACAFVLLLLRQMIWTPEGWLASPPNADNGVLAVIQSGATGLLVAPLATIILKPRWHAILYGIYFLAILTVQPIVELLLQSWFVTPFGTVLREWEAEHVWQIVMQLMDIRFVISNITWYGPQLLPTVVLFVLLRLAGGRLDDKKLAETG